MQQEPLGQRLPKEHDVRLRDARANRAAGNPVHHHVGLGWHREKALQGSHTPHLKRQNQLLTEKVSNIPNSGDSSTVKPLCMKNPASAVTNTLPALFHIAPRIWGDGSIFFEVAGSERRSWTPHDICTLNTVLCTRSASQRRGWGSPADPQTTWGQAQQSFAQLKLCPKFRLSPLYTWFLHICGSVSDSTSCGSYSPRIHSYFLKNPRYEWTHTVQTHVQSQLYYLDNPQQYSVGIWLTIGVIQWKWQYKFVPDFSWSDPDMTLALKTFRSAWTHWLELWLTTLSTDLLLAGQGEADVSHYILLHLFMLGLDVRRGNKGKKHLPSKVNLYS